MVRDRTSKVLKYRLDLRTLDACWTRATVLLTSESIVSVLARIESPAYTEIDHDGLG